MWIHRWPYGRRQCYGCILWPVRPVCAVPCVSVYTLTQGTAQASQVILCSHNTDNACTAVCVSAWTKRVILAKRWLAPWWWFPCKPKHVGAAFLICFNKLYMCVSWTIKGLNSSSLSSQEKKRKICLWRHHIVGVCVYPFTLSELPNQLNNVQNIWFDNYAVGGHLNGYCLMFWN